MISPTRPLTTSLIACAGPPVYGTVNSLISARLCKSSAVRCVSLPTPVIAQSLHSMGPTKKFAVPGHRISVPDMPKTVGDLPEGDTLVYLITIGGKFRIFLLRSANSIEKAGRGTKPGVGPVASDLSHTRLEFCPRSVD